MTDALFTVGFAALAVGLWWLAPWLCLTICGVIVMCAAARMEQTGSKGGISEGDS